MNTKGQFVTIVFSVLVITALLAIFNLEYNNLISNQNINLVQSKGLSSNAIFYNLVQQYSFFQSLGPSSQADSFLKAALSSINLDYFNNYVINLTNGVSVSSSFGSSVFK
jgi:hypothetical protein